MSAEVMTKKRAARIERRKAKIAALFKLECTPDEVFIISVISCML